MSGNRRQVTPGNQVSVLLLLRRQGYAHDNEEHAEQDGDRPRHPDDTASRFVRSLPTKRLRQAPQVPRRKPVRVIELDDSEKDGKHAENHSYQDASPTPLSDIHCVVHLATATRSHAETHAALRATGLLHG